MQALQNILHKFVKEAGIEGGVALNNLRRRWVEIVGQPISVHTYPDIVKGSYLTIVVDTPQWMHHLGFYKDDIALKLKPYGIAGIRFRLGRIPVKEEAEKEAEEADLTDEDLQYIENTVGSLKDEELKESFRKLIRHGLIRKIKDQK